MQRAGSREIGVKWRTEAVAEEKAEAEFKAGQARPSSNPFLLQKTREFLPRETEQSHRKGLQPNDGLPDNHSLMQCFSKFSLPRVADLPTVYYLSKHFVTSRNK